MVKLGNMRKLAFQKSKLLLKIFFEISLMVNKIEQ